MRHVPALVLATTLAACGGSGGGADGGNGGSPGDGSAIVTHEEQARALDAAAARLADLDFTEALPTSGTGTYAGHLGATATFGGAPVFVTAEVALTARFGAGTISGSFAEASAGDGTVTGYGRFEDGRFGPAGIEAAVTGTLFRSGDARTVEGDLRGAFLGAGAQGIAGAIEGRLMRNGAEAGRFDGELWAER